jgi:hypothetical protein
MIPVDKLCFTIAVLVNNTLFILSGEIIEGLATNILAIDVTDVSNMQIASSYPYNLATANSTSASNTTGTTNSTGTTKDITPLSSPSLSSGAKAGIAIGVIIGVSRYHYSKNRFFFLKKKKTVGYRDRCYRLYNLS